MVPERNIEDLDIPFRCVATDLYTGEEVVFSNGPLFEAIRASISIPSMFRPVQWQGRTLVDGGLVNTFPLNRVARRKGDILAGFNVNSVDVEAIRSYQTAVLRLGCETEALRERSRLLLDEVLSGSGRLGSRLHTVREKGSKLIEDTLTEPQPDGIYYCILRTQEDEAGDSYYHIKVKPENIIVPQELSYLDDEFYEMTNTQPVSDNHTME